MSLIIGQVLNNRYHIAKLLGQGGFGAVYKAWDLNLNLPCAIKENLDTSPEAQRQFTREANILANLIHPNLAHVTDYFFLFGQGQYLVMDYVEGEDLQTMLDRTGAPIPEVQALNWICQVCDALNYMHYQNPPIIHRDVKPANIKITPGGKAVLVDFGIAKIYDPNLKTTLGARAVTPGYSPQEQYGQGTTDARSDIYSLGATLYTLLTRHEPIESIQRTLGKPLPPLRSLNPILSPWTEQAVQRALNVLPDKRYQSAREFAAALQPGRHSSQPAKVAVPSPVRQPVTKAGAARPILAYAKQGFDWFRDCSAWILLILIVVFPLFLLLVWLLSLRTPSKFNDTPKPNSALLDTLGDHTGYIYSVAFSPDGQTLASGAADTTIRLWRVSDGNLLSTLEGSTGSMNSVAFSPDGQILASGSTDRTIRLWRVSDGSLPHTLEGHTSCVWSVAFSPDGKPMASVSNDGTIRLWGVP